MKKSLLIIAILGLTSLCANATYEVKYNNTGTVTNSTPSQFGSNASFTPKNRAIQGAKNRYIEHENQIYNGLENKNQSNINMNWNMNMNNSTNDNDNNQEEESSSTSTDRTKRTFVKNKFLKDKFKNEQ